MEISCLSHGDSTNCESSKHWHFSLCAIVAQELWMERCTQCDRQRIAEIPQPFAARQFVTLNKVPFKTTLFGAETDIPGCPSCMREALGSSRGSSRTSNCLSFRSRSLSSVLLDIFRHATPPYGRRRRSHEQSRLARPDSQALRTGERARRHVLDVASWETLRLRLFHGAQDGIRLPFNVVGHGTAGGVAITQSR